MASLAKQVAEAARGLVDRSATLSGMAQPPGRLLQLSAGLGNVMLLFHMVECSQTTLLSRFVALAHLQIAEIVGACSMRDLSFLAMPDRTANENTMAGTELTNLETEISNWSRACAQWICNAPMSVAMATERVMESAICSISPVAEDLSNRSLILLSDGLAQIRIQMHAMQANHSTQTIGNIQFLPAGMSEADEWEIMDL